MNELAKVFNYETTEVRTFLVDGQPWFVANDVCNILGFSKPSMTLKRLDEDEVNSTYVIDSLGRSQITNIVNEFGLYSLILGSKKKEAKQFKRWVTHEVLPSIRKTGFYINIEHPNVFETLKLALGLEKARELEQQNAESLQVKYGFAFHDPDYICQYECEQEGIKKSTFFRQLQEWGYVQLVRKPYKNLKYRKYQNFDQYQLTQKAIDKNVVQYAINHHAKHWKDVVYDGYCFRILKAIAYSAIS